MSLKSIEPLSALSTYQHGTHPGLALTAESRRGCQLLLQLGPLVVGQYLDP